jgi:oligopeptide/dipeptide ABC transporter ATP-binding protein
VTYSGGPPWNRHSVDAVKTVDLEINEGETVGLVGESGSGKTTVGMLCLGLLRPTRGQVLFDGRPFRAQRRRLKGKLQVVLQHPAWSLNPRVRVRTSVAEPLVVIRACGRAERERRVAEMLEHVGLDPAMADRFPHELSGGQTQRVAIARALITRPRIVVFDEAVSALDVSVQAQILNLIRTLQDEQRFAALFISHDLAAVRYISQRIAVMYAGDIVELAPRRHFYGHPFHPYSQALRRSMGAAEIGLSGTIEAAAAVGCPLSNRCPFVIDRCSVEKPLLRPYEGSWVACHRAEELTEAQVRDSAALGS